jgi:hypothetical protein
MSALVSNWLRGRVRKMRIYNVKEFPILKTQFLIKIEKLGFFRKHQDLKMYSVLKEEF